MKRALKSSVIYIFLILLVTSACRNSSPGAKQPTQAEYTCPMHPEILRDRSGACPICGMDLVLKTPQGGTQADTSLHSVLKPVSEQILANVQTISPERTVQEDSVFVRGRITYNPDLKKSISARVAGRIERLYITYNFQPVRKGQRLMDIYSPDLLAAQQDLLFLKSSGESRLLERAKARLRLLGVSAGQISRILQTGKIIASTSVFSPYTGYLIAGNGNTDSPQGVRRQPEQAANPGAMAGMGEAPSQPASQAPVPLSDGARGLREGQYVAQGQSLFSIVSSSSVWAEFYAASAQLPFFKKGATVIVSSLNDENKLSDAKVSLVQPFYSSDSRFSVIRAPLDNTGKLWKVGELISINPVNSENEGNWVPRKAVLQTGRRFIVFRKEGSVFVPRYVNVRQMTPRWADIGESLTHKDRIAANAWFLVDGDSFIQVKEL